jgi:hypothetical protein|tara:strand:- start:2554 stop:2817 length:264 start_codon:yes stop_codon:yes gene_type:complete
MIDFMQANLGFTAVFFGTIIYVLGNWMGRNHSEELIDNAISNTVQVTTELVVNDLIDSGYICCREEEHDGKTVSYMITYEEYISLNK